MMLCLGLIIGLVVGAGIGFLACGLMTANEGDEE